MPDTPPFDWSRHLEPGERLVWSGRPVPGVAGRDFVEQQALHGLLSVGFGLVWITYTWNMGPGLAATIATLWRGEVAQFGALPFLLFPYVGHLIAAFGLWMLLRPVWRGRALARQAYALTDRRALIATETRGAPRLRAWPIATMPEIELIDGPPGDVIFDRQRRTHTRTGNDGWQTDHVRTLRTGFRRIPEAMQVYAMLAELQAARRPPAAPGAPWGRRA